ncbi:hypothetical protein [Pseudooceanicola nanhaiensis]|uniref:hypothetical protein n=1 Tax=Pseudooceanicola nanhaiensis TaxID=375761 RepID=UPI001CD23C1F|nr:hypothetical protein [Pseudooceanicola nanhaiensis]MCA0919701.1 hypothetical protein [Pseudooceanicola nanhaiensis]
MPTMKAVAENDPISEPVGSIIGRPAILLAGFARGQDKSNDLVALIVHGEGSDELRVQTYRVRQNLGTISRLHGGTPSGDIEGSPGAALTKDWLVTAAHGENSGRLFLITWDMTSMGAERKGDSGTQFGPPGGTADIAYLGGTKAVVALKDADENLRVIVFDAKSGGGGIVRHDGDAAGKILDNPSIAAAGPVMTGNGLQTPALNFGPSFVVTAIKANDGRLKLICWEVGGNNISRRGDSGNAGPEITGRPAIAGWLKQSLVVTAYIDADGDALRVQAHQVKSDGSLVRTGSGMATKTPEHGRYSNTPSIAFVRGDAGGGQIATAVRTTSGRLRVDTWSVSDSGTLTSIAHGVYDRTDRKIEGSPSICSAVIGDSSPFAIGYYAAARLAGSNRPTLTKWIIDPN